jgi:hypothetical protein
VTMMVPAMTIRSQREIFPMTSVPRLMRGRPP